MKRSYRAEITSVELSRLATLIASAWRPPGFEHGLDSSLTGFLLLCRSPGANKTVSVWSAHAYPVNDAAPYNLILPSEFAAIKPTDLAVALTY